MNQIKPLTTVAIATKIIIFCNISIFFPFVSVMSICNRGGRITRHPNFRINYLLTPYIFREYFFGVWKRKAFTARIQTDICSPP